MRRRIRWLILAVVVLVVAGAVVAIVSTEPTLSDARQKVDAAWTPLRPSLVVRYQALGGVEQALDAGGFQTRTVTVDLHAALAQWQRVAGVDDPAEQAPLANELEGLALRVKANVTASPRLQMDTQVAAALAAFDRSLVSPPAVLAYNRAVQAYQQDRTGTINHLVASVFGFGARPELILAA